MSQFLHVMHQQESHQYAQDPFFTLRYHLLLLLLSLRNGEASGPTLSGSVHGNLHIPRGPAKIFKSCRIAGAWLMFNKIATCSSAWNVTCQVAKLCRLMTFLSFFKILSHLFEKNFGVSFCTLTSRVKYRQISFALSKW